MNDILDHQEQQTYEINIRFVFVNGDTFEQPLSIDEADGVQDLIDWFRDPKAIPVWTWKVPSMQKSHMLHKTHIMSIDVDGYIEPDGRESRWFERLVDRIRVMMLGHS